VPGQLTPRIFSCRPHPRRRHSLREPRAKKTNPPHIDLPSAMRRVFGPCRGDIRPAACPWPAARRPTCVIRMKHGCRRPNLRDSTQGKFEWGGGVGTRPWSVSVGALGGARREISAVGGRKSRRLRTKFRDERSRTGVGWPMSPRTARLLSGLRPRPWWGLTWHEKTARPPCFGLVHRGNFLAVRLARLADHPRNFPPASNTGPPHKKPDQTPVKRLAFNQHHTSFLPWVLSRAPAVVSQSGCDTLGRRRRPRQQAPAAPPPG